MGIGSLWVDAQASPVRMRCFAVAIQFFERLALIGKRTSIPRLPTDQSLEQGERSRRLFLQNVCVRQVILRFLEFGVKLQRQSDFRLGLGKAARLPIHEAEREANRSIAW